MNLIEKLGLEKCQAIVDGAPKWAKWWCVDKEKFLDFIPCSKCVDVNDLRTAIANHNTDHCTDIGYHLSPLTEVSER